MEEKHQENTMNSDLVSSQDPSATDTETNTKPWDPKNGNLLPNQLLKDKPTSKSLWGPAHPFSTFCDDPTAQSTKCIYILYI